MTVLYIRQEGGVIAYPVMQAYGSLALEDNLDVNEALLDRSSILVSAPAPSTYQPMKKTHRLQCPFLTRRPLSRLGRPTGI